MTNSVPYNIDDESEQFKILPDGRKVPIIPKIDPPNIPLDSNPVVAVCGECGLDLRKVMHYACPHANCPCFYRVTC